MKKALLWILAFILTAGSAVYQRKTGPTYALKGKISLGESLVSYTLERSHETVGDYELKIEADNPEISGYVLYQRFKTDDPWIKVPMSRENGALVAFLPMQPAAGKLAYRVFLTHRGEEVPLSGEQPVIIRFKDVVPDVILIPHIIVMFLAMLFSTRAGLEALRKDSNPRKLALWAAGLMFVGGFILGPLVQKFAFGDWWTGFPLGFDLTDNKTLIAMVGWMVALIAGRKGRPARGWILAAAVLTLVIFLIPHSLLGSELDYSQLESQVPQIISARALPAVIESRMMKSRWRGDF
ncbi:MAG: hypothetical protein PVF22_06645 [Candidatus Aminicenantes bacterium]|jgi:hypothetical protein